MKFDGFHIVTLKDGGHVRLWSRFGNDLTARFPAICESVDKALSSRLNRKPTP
jgi:ATP-dependent DNA ligase